MKAHNPNVKRLEREPEKFDVLDLFDAIGRDRKYILGNQNDENAFIDTVSKSLSLNKTPTLIYGRRVETMFAYVVASLGKATLIKKEDCGDIFCGNAMQIPDYRVLLGDGTQLLVEVKNYHQNTPFKSYSMKKNYLNGLSRYAELMKTDLLIAIYWSKWSIWTLVTPDDFKCDKTKATINFTAALERNQMVHIGDYAIGTTPPLSIRIYPDKKHSHGISNNTAEFTIGSVELLCNNTPITNENEKRIAFALMLYGNWKEDNIIFPSPNSYDKIEYIEFSYYPIEYDKQQGFCIVDSLSTIISRQYGQLTAPDGKVVRISPDIAPGMLGFIVPEDYKGHSLPLWRFQIKPKEI